MYQTSRSGWSEWSVWIWNPDYQQYYRQRVDASGSSCISNTHLPVSRKFADDNYAGASDIQWQSEYEAAQNNQTPRTPVEQMTQQFGAVNIRSPEQTGGDEQNSTFYLVLASWPICAYLSLNKFVDEVPLTYSMVQTMITLLRARHRR
jgi:hypothetical protein